jgi:hypothetical protein
MANVKISALPQVTTLTNSDVLPSVASLVTSQITLKNLANSFPQVTSSISASNALTASYINPQNGISISGSLLMSGSIIPAAGVGDYTSSFSLGNSTNAWKDLWVSNGTIYLLGNTGAIQGTVSSTATGVQLGSSVVSGSFFVKASGSVGITSTYFVAEYQGKPSKALALFESATFINGDLIGYQNAYPILPFDKKYNSYFIQNNGATGTHEALSQSLTLSLPPWYNTRLSPGETVTVYNMTTGSATNLDSGKIYITSMVQQITNVVDNGGQFGFVKRVQSTTNNGVLLSGSWQNFTNINPVINSPTTKSIALSPGQKGTFELIQFPIAMDFVGVTKFTGNFPTSGSIDDTYIGGNADYRMGYRFVSIQNI